MENIKKIHLVVECYTDMDIDVGDAICAAYTNKDAAQKHIDAKQSLYNDTKLYIKEIYLDNRYITDKERFERDITINGEIQENFEFQNENGNNQIKIIKYQNKLYCHKMLNGKIISVKQLT